MVRSQLFAVLRSLLTAALAIHNRAEHEDGGDEEDRAEEQEDGHISKYGITQDKICELLNEYLLDEFTQTNILGRYVNRNGAERDYSTLEKEYVKIERHN